VDWHRRKFLSLAGLTSFSAVAAACAKGFSSKDYRTPVPSSGGAGVPPGAAAGGPVPPHQVYDAHLPQVGPESVKQLVLEARDDTAIALDNEVGYPGWSFNGTIPAPVLRVRQGDTVQTTVTNRGSQGHSIDFHAAQTPWNQYYQLIVPGDSFSFTWTANHPGVFMYHCGTAPVLHHIANGMYGAIIVDPITPMRPAREYVLVQSEFYPSAGTGMRTADMDKMAAGDPRYVVFNGYANQYQAAPLAANPGELIRLYMVNAGPTLFSAFHVIGALFESVYPSGSPESALRWLQTWTVAPGDGAIFELTIPDEGLYPFVTHSFAYTGRGALGLIRVGNPPPLNAAKLPEAAATPAASKATAAPVTATAAVPAAVQAMQQTTTDNKFSATQMTAQAGKPITLTVTNKGQAIHNWNLVGQTGAEGTAIKTGLLNPGETQTITFTMTKPGTYSFQCDVHPAEMKGTLTVK
jgi:nitrite reductase (NO-forming)